MHYYWRGVYWSVSLRGSWSPVFVPILKFLRPIRPSRRSTLCFGHRVFTRKYIVFDTSLSVLLLHFLKMIACYYYFTSLREGKIWRNSVKILLHLLNVFLARLISHTTQIPIYIRARKQVVLTSCSDRQILNLLY